MEYTQAAARSSSLRIAAATAAAVLVGTVAFGALEAGYLAAAVDEDQVEISLVVDAVLSISSPANVSLGTINGTGQSVTSSADFNVITNNTSGYRFDIKASSSPAMRCSSGGCAVNSDSFADYTPATADVPETWSVAASASEFGISASGTAASSSFLTGQTYYNLTTAYRWIAGQNTQTTGATTSVIYRAEIGASKVQPTGVYTATTTAQVTTL
jgi:hypothetical protein